MDKTHLAKLAALLIDMDDDFRNLLETSDIHQFKKAKATIDSLREKKRAVFQGLLDTIDAEPLTTID